MGQIKFKDRQIEIDDEGYLGSPDDWDKEVAQYLAERDEIELTSEHWKVLDYLRHYYSKYRSIPPGWKVTRVLLKRMNKTIEWLYSLFNGKEQALDAIYKIAGFPKQYG